MHLFPTLATAEMDLNLPWQKQLLGRYGDDLLDTQAANLRTL